MGTLKYPAGEFTQAELATFNGMDKADVYLPMKEDQENGIIEKTGTRPTGKRPANLYRIADPNAPVPVPAPQPPPTIVETPSPQPTPPLVSPEIPPTVETPSVVNLESKAKTDYVEFNDKYVKAVPSTVLEFKSLPPNPSYPCPLCQGPMTETPDATGVMVKCFNEPCDPQCKENVFGHGKNAKDAYDIAKQKFPTP